MTLSDEWLLGGPVEERPVCDGVLLVPVTASAYEIWRCCSVSFASVLAVFTAVGGGVSLVELVLHCGRPAGA